MATGTRSKSTVTLKSAEEIELLSREDLILYSIAVTGLCERLMQMEQRIEVLESDNQIQKNANVLLKERADILEERIVKTERTITNDSQYLRRRQLEVSNVSETIDDRQLKNIMSNFLSMTGQEVDQYDIDVIHRMKKKTTVIMELRNRTIRAGVLGKRKNLASVSPDQRKELAAMGLANSCYINESLCSEYHRLFYVCRRLKSDNHIKDCWFFGGKLIAVDHANKKSRIEHITDTYAYALVDAISRYLK